MKAKQRRCSERTKQERPSQTRARSLAALLPPTTCCVLSVSKPASPPLQSYGQWPMNINIVLLMDRAHICRAHRQVRSRVDSGMESLGNRRSIAKRQGAEALPAPSVLFRLLAMWAGEGMRDGQGREEVASKAPIAQCPSHSRRTGSTICAWASGMLPTKNEADLTGWTPPAKRCSPTGGWPMLLKWGP